MRLIRPFYPVLAIAIVVPNVGLGTGFALSQTLYVSNHQGGNSVAKFDLEGNFLGYLAEPGEGGLLRATGIRQGLDGCVLVSSEGTGKILKFDPLSGDYLGVFAEAADGGNTSFMTFGPDDNLYVADVTANRVARYDGNNGDFLGFAAQDGNLNGPDGIHFLDDGTMLVSSYFSNEIKHYNPQDGTFLGNLTSNISRPLEILESHQADELLVVAQGSNGIARLDEETGDLLGMFASGNGLLNPVGIIELPNGDYLVSSYSNHKIIRFDSEGNLIGEFASGIRDGLRSPTNMVLAIPSPGTVAPVALCAWAVTRRKR